MGTPANSLDITQAGLVKFDGVSNFSGVTVTQFNTLVGASSNGISSISPGTSLQVLTSNGAGSNPSYQTISNSGLPGSGQITLSNGTNISVSGSPVALGGAATINVAGPLTPTSYTANGILFGNGAGALQVTAQGAANTVLLGNGGVPSFGTVPNAALTNSSITLSNGANITVSGSPVSLGGTATIAVSGATQHAVQIGSAAGALSSVSVGATNTVLLGNTGADPSFGTVPNAALTNSSVTLANGNNITITGSPVSLGGTATVNVSGTTNHAVQLGNASGSLTSASLLTNGQLLIGSTGANPVAATLTAGTGISITNNAGTITISVTGGAMSTVPQLVFISSATASGGPVQFTSLSSTYSGFRFYYEGLTVSGTDIIIVQVSSNNGVSYDTGNNYANSSSAKNGLIPAGPASITNLQSDTGYCDIFFTNQANDLVTCVPATVVVSAVNPSYYKIQAAINAVQFTVAGANNLASGTIYMYGIP